MHSYKRRLGYLLASILAGISPLLPIATATAQAWSIVRLPLLSAVQAGGVDGSPSDADEFIQLHNTSSSLIDLSDLRLEYVRDGHNTVVLRQLSGQLGSDGYALYGHTGWSEQVDGEFGTPQDHGNLAASDGTLQITDSEHNILDSVSWGSDNQFAAGHWLQTKSGGRTIWHSDAFTMQGGNLRHIEASPPTTSEASDAVGTNPANDQPDTTRSTSTTVANSVLVSEILPYAKSCAPDIAVCADFIELHNQSDQPVMLDGYRLRTSYGGSKLLHSNSITLDGLTLAPNAFAVIDRLDPTDDGSQAGLALTNSGGSVWLEQASDSTSVSAPVTYPDANSHPDQSWALDSGGSWRWSTTPTPGIANNLPAPSNASSVAPAPIIQNLTAAAAGTTAASSACKAGWERNAITHHCRLIRNTGTDATSTLSACLAGQIRNTETHRCRSAQTNKTSATAACPTGKSRSDTTHRCVGATASSAAACKSGQVRNPATNRCHKASGTATTGNLSGVHDRPTPTSKQRIAWLSVGGIALAAIGYGIYEWRQEIVRFGRSQWARLSTSKHAKSITATTPISR